MRVAMIGATGLIGRTLAPMLAKEHELTVIGRRASGVIGARDVVAPIERWGEPLPGPVDVAISTVGSTLRQAGSFEAFRAVDETAVLAFASSARAAGARHFIFTSSVGADSGSRSPYLRLKGEVEQELRALGFDRLDLVRPGLLRGERGADRRFGERLAIAVSPVVRLFLRGSLDRFAAIDATTVAEGIAHVATLRSQGCFVRHNRDLVALAR